MKKTKYILLLTLSALSFYITDKVLIFIDEQKPLMKEIKQNTRLLQLIQSLKTIQLYQDLMVKKSIIKNL